MFNPLHNEPCPLPITYPSRGLLWGSVEGLPAPEAVPQVLPRHPPIVPDVEIPADMLIHESGVNALVIALHVHTECVMS